MCMVSMIIEAGQKIPDLNWNQEVWKRYMNIIDQTKELDNAFGQPNCEDQEKKAWIDRIDDLMKKRAKVTHELKTDPKYMDFILSGEKTFEVRRNDRQFRFGDYLLLKDYYPNPDANQKIRSIVVEVTYLLDHPDYVKPGYVIMSIKKV